MKRFLLAITLVLALCAAQSSRGHFIRLQTEQVPISRLFTNLQSRLKTNANDFVTLYQLARLHAMAYSTNLSAINVTTNDGEPVFALPGSDSGVPHEVVPSKDRPQALAHLTNSIAFYERALAVLRKLDISPTMQSSSGIFFSGYVAVAFIVFLITLVILMSIRMASVIGKQVDEIEVDRKRQERERVAEDGPHAGETSRLLI